MLQGAKDVCLAAADDVTRQRCLRIIEAASASWTSLPDIASSAALTRGLLDMKSLAAVKAVLVALRVAVDHPSLKAVGFDPSSLTAEMTNRGHSDAIQRCRVERGESCRTRVLEIRAAGCGVQLG